MKFRLGVGVHPEPGIGDVKNGSVLAAGIGHKRKGAGAAMAQKKSGWPPCEFAGR